MNTTQQILNTAVVGCGAISDIYLENMIHHFDNLNVTACCANHLEHAKTKADAYGLKGCTYEEILKNPSIDMGNITDGGVLTTLAFQQIPVLGPVILVVGIISFAYSTVLGWAYYGERCVEYFAGKKGLIPYRVLYIAVAAIAPVISLNLVWTIADILNALMALPNLVAVLLLSNVIVKETRKYIDHLDAKDETPIEVIDK